MSEHELEKLLGGFAADTLTPEERQKLFEAALQEQQLFNALADEQALKELLTDPVVRRRLLDALPQMSLSRSSGSPSWWEWLRRPAGLTFAGGLAAAIVAVVIGTKVYQDSLKQAAQSVATEEARPTASPAPATPTSQPAPPSIVEPQLKTRESAEPIKEKDALHDKVAKQERPSTPPSRPQEQRASESAGDRVQRNAPDAVRKQADAPVAPTPAPLASVAASRSARALFYERGATRADEPAMAREKGRARLEQKAEPFAASGKSADGPAQPKPLGLRYSFITSGPDKKDKEIKNILAFGNGPFKLVVEANQTGYLYVVAGLKRSDKLLFPMDRAARITAHVPNAIPYPDTRPYLTIVLSRESLPEFEEAVTSRDFSLAFSDLARKHGIQRNNKGLIVERVDTPDSDLQREHATYVVHPDAKASVLNVDNVTNFVR